MDFTINQDTICAIATPVGEGGIGIIRISGPEALGIARSLFRPTTPSVSLKSHRLYHGWIWDPASEERVDEVLMSYMGGPRTYTREDVVEINCHSGYAVLDRILELVLQAGARLAEPGEFTRRAFLSGRIDLSQAEAVIEIIHSRSQQSLLLANRHLQGDFRRQVLAWKETILQYLSLIEASIDFAEDLEEDSEDLALPLQKLKEELLEPIRQALTQYERGRMLREGLTLVLVGKPNVGKSSLLNALMGKERAIVTPFPGTTRDVIEDSFLLSGVLVRILDTAGIRHEPDEIESLGIERTLKSVSEADVVLWLIDGSRPLSAEDDSVFQGVGSRQCMILLNKQDLPPAVTPEEIRERFHTSAPIIQLSALEHSDIDSLRGRLTEAFLKQPLEEYRSMLLPNIRHKECLEQALESLTRARELIQSGSQGELAAIELHSARSRLDAILGLEGDEDLLDRIFSQFCIGK